MNKIIVFTTEGYLKVNAETGMIQSAHAYPNTALVRPWLSGERIPHDPAPPSGSSDSFENSISCITKFDMAEFRTHYKYNSDSMPLTVDILDVGHWKNINRKIHYEAPVADYRSALAAPYL